MTRESFESDEFHVDDDCDDCAGRQELGLVTPRLTGASPATRVTSSEDGTDADAQPRVHRPPSQPLALAGIAGCLDWSGMRARLAELTVPRDVQAALLPQPTDNRSRQAVACRLESIHRQAPIDRAMPRDAAFVEDEWNHRALVWSVSNTVGRGVYLSGSYGSGKTVILLQTLRMAQQEGAGVCFCKLQSLTATLARLRWKREERYETVLDALARVDVLALDDVLATSLPRQELDEFLAVLDARMDAGNPILATSNHRRDEGFTLALGEWRGNDRTVAERLLSRLGRLTGPEVNCDYPGDRRRGLFFPDLAETFRARRQAEDDAAEREEANGRVR